MPNRIIRACLLLVTMFTTAAVSAQSWPVKLVMDNGDQIKIYEPQPEQFTQGSLQFQSAVALQRKDSDMPIFGTLWAKAEMQANSSNASQVIESLSVTGMRFPSEVNEEDTRVIQSFLETALPGANASMKTEDLQSALKMNAEKKQLDASFVNKAPKVYYRNKPSMMVLIDGEPKFQRNKDWGMDAVVNSPNTIVRLSDNQFFLYGGKNWYEAAAVGGPYRYVSNPPSALSKLEESLSKNQEKDSDDDANKAYDSEYEDDNGKPVSEVLVSNEPAELIQSNGEPSFSPIENTNLLFVENSPNDIFMDIASQQYFVLISGRWYRAASMNSSWNYVEADALPADFAKIPAGSPKDNVLASVAGTPAASNALMDAQLPQTARVDRNSTPNSIVYDGTPEFQKINGTRMSYAVNTSSTVIKYRNSYFLVENGVWFQSGSPSGPWEVSTQRPDEVELIPPSYPVYNVKYVYVYDYTPDYVYMGYTPGYLNTFVYGPTVVYGTGWYYRPWYGNYYFARPYTWGFNMHYNPWYGWSIGFNYSPGWFNYGWGYQPWSSWYGGWWGPSLYRPAYCGPYNRHYGYYGYRNNHFYVNSYRGRGGYGGGYGYNRPVNNIYRQRTNISTRTANRYDVVRRPDRSPNRGSGNGFNNVNNNNRPSRPDITRPQGNNNNRPRPITDTRPANSRPSIDRGPNSNRPQRSYEPARRDNTNQPQQRPQFERRETPQQRPQIERRQAEQRPSFERREAPAQQRQQFERREAPQQRQQFERREAPQPRQYSQQQRPSFERSQAPQQRQQTMQRPSAPARSEGSFGNRGGGGGGGGSRPQRRGN